LSQKIGWRKAVLIMAIPFGLFHLPGMASVPQAVNMVITTALYSLVFSLAFILTGSLWAAIGVHVVSNIILHLISGLDGGNTAMFIPIFDARWPSGYNLSLVLFIINSIFISSCLYICIIRKAKVLSGQNIISQG
ncbi:MAG TPA: CPBP family intramembrane glutamic endopeptidase, partial [Mucilaginibacter sp.]|nr:CPBP family intramembrane glutamic endopeptidase [Mucilaginibacter sp.]